MSAVLLRASLVAALALLVAAAPASAKVPRDWLGVMVDGPMTDPAFDAGDEWQRLGDSGAGHVRAEFYWPRAQPSGPDAIDFAASDTVVLAAAREGLGMLPVVRGTPGWAGASVASPPRRAAFAAALTALVADDSRRAELRAAGLERAAGFTWDATARAVDALLFSPAAAPGPSARTPAAPVR